MENYTELINLLNDLVHINIDRVKELKKRLNDLAKNSELVPLLKRLIKESYEFKQQLVGEVQKKGGEAIKKAAVNTGRIYNSWKELKNCLMQKKGLSTLEIVQYDTKAALKLYKEAVFMVANIPADSLDLIATQKAHLKKDCEKIEIELIRTDPRSNFLRGNYFKTKINF